MILTIPMRKKRRMIFAQLLILLALSLLYSSTLLAADTSQHKLIGKIWSVKQERFINVDVLKKKILSSDHTAVGETHDNPVHHKIQAQVLNWFLDANKPVNPVFEMLSQDQMAHIKINQLNSSDSFFDKVSWDESGWPDRKLYKPIIDLVIKHDFPITAAETSREVLMKLMKKGESELPEDIANMLKTVPLNESAQAMFKEEIINSHCGMLPEKMIEPMILGQRVRDVVMARSVLEAGKDGPTLLIAGSGHARNDVGVLAYLKKHNANTKTTSIAMMEVVDDVIEPNTYGEAWASNNLPFDYVWFTERVKREDPCEEMRQHFKKHAA